MVSPNVCIELINLRVGMVCSTQWNNGSCGGKCVNLPSQKNLLQGCRTIKSNNLKSIQQSKESELPETAILKSKAHYPTFLAASYKVYGSTITLKTAAQWGKPFKKSCTWYNLYINQSEHVQSKSARYNAELKSYFLNGKQ